MLKSKILKLLNSALNENYHRYVRKIILRYSTQYINVHYPCDFSLKICVCKNERKKKRLSLRKKIIIKQTTKFFINSLINQKSYNFLAFYSHKNYLLNIQVLSSIRLRNFHQFSKKNLKVVKMWIIWKHFHPLQKHYFLF